MKSILGAVGSLRSRAGELWAELRADESGQDLIEYALVALFIGLAAVAALSSLTGNIISVFAKVGTTLTSAS